MTVPASVTVTVGATAASFNATTGTFVLKRLSLGYHERDADEVP